MPFEVYNPWGTDSSGWALGTFNGHEVYGLFNADATFLSQNFATQTFGTGTAAGLDDHGNSPQVAPGARIWRRTSSTRPWPARPAPGANLAGSPMAPVIVAPEVALPMPLVLTQVPDKARAALHHDLALDALQQHDFGYRPDCCENML